MKNAEYMPTVVDFAHQVIDMDNELRHLRGQVSDLEGYRQKYIDLLNESAAHSAHMIGGLLEIAMVPGVMRAVSENNKTQERDDG